MSSAQRVRAAPFTRWLVLGFAISLGVPVPLFWAAPLVYWSTFMEEMRLAPGAVEVLTGLAGTHELAIVSNHTAAIQLRKIQKLGLAPHFSAVITSEEVGVEKPHARVFEAALASVGVNAANALMVGDDLRADMAGARSSGLRTVLSTEFSAAQPGTRPKVLPSEVGTSGRSCQHSSGQHMVEDSPEPVLALHSVRQGRRG